MTGASGAMGGGAARINAPRLLDIAELAQVGAIEGGGVCRLALTEADRQGRDLVVRWMREAGLAVTIDGSATWWACAPPAGRTARDDRFAYRHGAPAAADGNLGVLAGLEVIAALNDAGVVTRRPVAVAFFTNEEGRASRRHDGQSGLPGRFAAGAGAGHRGHRRYFGGRNLARIGYAGTAATGNNRVHAFVELHVEQGPVLEHEEYTIGAVTGVQGIHWIEFTLRGVSNHAGTTPMALRHDAGIVAARIACFARDLTREMGEGQLATVGQVELFPNLINVIPNRATFTLDLRNTDGTALRQAIDRCMGYAEQAAAEEAWR